jgi:AraC family transcriptional regulator
VQLRGCSHRREEIVSSAHQVGTHGISIPAPCADAGLSLHSAGQNLPWHEHAAPYVCLVLSGGFLEAAPTSADERHVGDIVFHPAGERHADRFGPQGACCLNLRVPELRWSGVRRASAAVRAAAGSIAAQAALGPYGDSLEAESSVAEIMAELDPPSADNPNAVKATVGAPVDRVAEALDDQPEHPWTLGELARLADRHPAHLARAFRLVAGMSIGEYRRRNRLVALSLSLRCTSESLGDLAVAHGYADQAHMTREFRRFAGCPPGTWRRRLR